MSILGELASQFGFNPRTLRYTEKDFYSVRMKNYGRAPTFLMLTGYEQVC